MRVLSSFLLLVLLSGQAALAQPDTLWTCRINYGSPGPMVNGATALADGGIVVVGVNDPAAANKNMFVARVSPFGQVLWMREYGTSNRNEQANGVAELHDGTLVVVGCSGPGAVFNTISILGLSGEGDSLWSREYYGEGTSQGNDAAALDDGNFVVCGYRPGTIGNQTDLWLIECDPSGEMIWEQLYGGEGTDIGSRIVVESDGTLAIGGYTTSWGNGQYDMWLLRTDAQGNQLSSETFGTSGQEICYGICLADVGEVLAGRNLSGSDLNGYVGKADDEGVPIWSFSYSAGHAVEEIHGVVAGLDGNITCAGWSGASAANLAPWYLTIAPNGTRISSYIYSDLPQGRFIGIAYMPSGGFMIYGIIMNGNVRQGYVMKLAPQRGISGTVRSLDTGQPLSGIHVGVVRMALYSTTNPEGRFLLEADSGNYDIFATGRCYSNDTLFQVIVDADSITDIEFSLGTPQFEQPRTSLNFQVHNHVISTAPLELYNAGTGPLNFGTSTEELYPATAWLTVEPSSGVVQSNDSLTVSVTVQADTTNDGIYDYFGYIVVHTNSCPDSTDRLPVLVTVLDALRRSNQAAYDFALLSAYPNPFNPVTTLSFSVPRDARVRIVIYDVVGREVRVAADAIYAAGMHTFSFDATGLPSGLYIARMASGTFSATQKLLLLK